MEDVEPRPEPASPPPNEAENGDHSGAELHIRLELAPGTHLRVRVDAHDPQGNLLDSRSLTLENPAAPPAVEQAAGLQAASRPAQQSFWSRLIADWPLLLLVGVLAIYLITRFTGLTHFPIYFFTDEAIQTVAASDLLRDQFRGEGGEFLPTYFKNGGQYNLSLSVYLQVIPTLLFGKLILVTRGVSALISMLAVLAVGLALRNAFSSRAAWAGALLLTLTPAWFLHSRTAFETVLAVSFYAAFLYCYLMYRQGKVGYLYAAVVFAALTFYSYSPGQMVILVTVILLLLSDLRFHWQQRRLLLRGLGLALVLAIPYARFQILHTGETLRHLEILGSYWVQDLSAGEKIMRFLGEYLRGINPVYWYDRTPEGLSRHIMKGYSYLWLPGLPFVILGLGLALKRIRRAEYRAVLAALLAAPTGSALVGPGITRLLFVVVPAGLLAGIGLSAAIQWLAERFRKPQVRERVFLALSLATFILMSAASFAMLNDALVNGPTWFEDYGLGGMQYGAEQIFNEIRAYLKLHPDVKLTLSPSWANGTDVIARYFFDDPLPFSLGSIEGYLQRYIPIEANEVFVLLPEELRQARSSGKFKSVVIERTVDYPNGQPGFYFTRLTYVDGAESIFAAEQEKRRALLEGTVTLADGSQAAVAYSQLDMGEIDQAFDGDTATLIRTYEANPFKIILDFEQAYLLQGLSLRVGGVPTRVTVLAYAAGESLPRTYTVEGEETPEPQTLEIDFRDLLPITELQIEIRNIRDGEPSHVHLWEVIFR